MSHVPTGYSVGRDARGLTRREREVMMFLVEGLNMPQIGEQMGVTKQRVEQLMDALERKGAIRREGGELIVVVRDREVGRSEGRGVARPLTGGEAAVEGPTQEVGVAEEAGDNAGPDGVRDSDPVVGADRDNGEGGE